MPDSLVIWLLPVFFIVHEIEEVIAFPRWTRRNEMVLTQRFPSLSNRLHYIKSPAFRIAVVEELSLITLFTAATYFTGYVVFWYAALLAFGLHFFVHLAQFFVLLRYVPSMITFVICMPYCVYGFMQVECDFTTGQNILLMFASIIVFIINLFTIRRIAINIWSFFSKDSDSIAKLKLR